MASGGNLPAASLFDVPLHDASRAATRTIDQIIDSIDIYFIMYYYAALLD
jgi:hypothetical protein